MAKPRRKKKARVCSNEGEAAAPVRNSASVLPPPDHVSEEIFLRLPPESIAASRCVAPSWNRLLSSPAFAERYHAAAAARAADRPRFLTVPVHANYHKRHSASADEPLGSVTCVECPRVFAGAGKACHGLVLVGRLCEGHFYACNPSTGGVLRLPPRRPTSCFHSAGLGYDAAAGRFKAVLLERAWVPRRRSLGPPTPRFSAVVVTVGAPQWRWREQKPRGAKARVACGDALVSTKMDPVFAAGHLHWMLSAPPAAPGARQDVTGVLSFSLDDESFRRIPLPPADGDREQQRARQTAPPPPPEHSTLAELDGHLCFVRDLRSRRDGVAVFEVWKHAHRSRSWTLDCRVDLTRHVGKLMLPWALSIFPLCYIGGESSGRSKKTMLLLTTTRSAHKYELGTRKLFAVTSGIGTLQQMQVFPQYFRVLLYQESSVHISGMEYAKQDIRFIP
ncbi:hypothetical protein ACP4OV_005911 [Aristida adscensionis]